jgi:hypothetical protein
LPSEKLPNMMSSWLVRSRRHVWLLLIVMDVLLAGVESLASVLLAWQ